MDPIRSERLRPDLFAASGLYLLAAVGLWAANLCAPALARVCGTQEGLQLMLSLLYYAGFVILPLGLWLRRREGMEDCLRLNPLPRGTMLPTVCLAILCVLIVYDFSVLWSALWQRLGLNVFAEEYVRPETKGQLMRSVIAAAVIAPVSEELLFRGVLLSAWEHAGTKKAVLITAALFAMFHGSVLGLPGELFGGAVLAMAVLWTDSLYTGMVFHSVYNAALVMMNYLATAAPTEESAAMAVQMEADIVAAMGGWTAMAALALEIAVYLLLAAVILRRFMLRARLIGFERAQVRGVHIGPGTALLLLLSAACMAGFYAMDFMMMRGG